MEFQINTLKFLAILAVVGLHFMNRFFNADSLDNPSGTWLLVLNQFFRYCVPLFVMLSGYTLSKKYIDQPLDAWKFYTRRVWKILPLYIFWSYLIYLLLHFPNLTSLLTNFNWIKIIIWGGADYHLYFVPMIFQLYLLFPILLWLIKKFPKGMLTIFAIFQIGLYAYWSQQLILTHGTFISDQQQYIFFGNWLLYFIFGIYLHWQSPSQISKLTRICGWMTLVGFTLVIIEAFSLVHQGLNLIVVTRFSKLSVLLYAASFSIWIILMRKKLFDNLTPISGLLMKLGDWAFLVYLSHTVILRLLWMVIDNQFNISNQVLLYFLVITLGLILSTSWSRIQNFFFTQIPR